ncbi:hypothetical protein AAFF_G00115180, partial [Aldrovandia affinis]
MQSFCCSSVLGQDGWSVSYQHERICALKGSSVDMPCTYSYPYSNRVETTFWFVEETADLAETPEYKGRVEYRGNKEHDCTLRVRGLRKSDSKTYFFRFLTNRDKYYGQGGSTLSVTDLQVEVNPATVTEGQRVTLTCRTTCTLSGSPAFIWYKNKLPLSTTNMYNNYLQFTASSEDSGSYSCGVRDHENLSFPAVTLSVRYAPKSTSVSVSPSGEIVEGSSVTLICISNANPPVQRYTWFKNNAPKSTSVSVSPSGEIVEGSSVTLTCSSNANPPVQRYTWFKNSTAITSWRGSEQSYTIKDIKPLDSGEYYCEAVNGVGSGSSHSKLLNVQYAPKSTSVSVSPSGEIVEGSSVTLTCSSNANPPVHRYTWFKKNDTGVWQTGSGQSLNVSNFRSWNSGQYYCEAENKHGVHNSTALSITTKGGQTEVILTAVGITACVLLVLLAVLLWMRKSNFRSKSKEDTGNTEQDKE